MLVYRSTGGKQPFSSYVILTFCLPVECIDLTAKMLAIGLANAVAITSPQKIIFSGGLSQAGDLLLNPFRKYLEENLYPVFRGKIVVEQSALKENDTAILGAAALNY